MPLATERTSTERICETVTAVVPDGVEVRPGAAVVAFDVLFIRPYGSLAVADPLDHFGQLLDTYAAGAEGEDAAPIATVSADNDRARRRLATLMLAPHSAAFDAHELYRVRELVETGLYVG